MFEEQFEEQVVEETSKAMEETVVEDVSTDEESVPTAPADIVAEIKDYLNPGLFDDVRVIKKEEMEDYSNKTEVNQELEKAYAGTLVDISEHSLITGRVVGLTERDVLIDIGFKSEGIIDRVEFDEENLPSVGDQIEVYLEYIEDAGGNTILSKEKADFLRRWTNLKEAFENEKSSMVKLYGE